MARSPAQSLKEKSGSPISRSDPKHGGHELACNEMVLSDCYTKIDHGLKRARQGSEPRVWKYRPMSPNDCQEAHDYTPTGTGATTRARQDIEHRLDDKTVENEINSLECSPTTCTEYWAYSSELSPSSLPYSPGWSYNPRSSGTPPYEPGCWSYSPASPNHCQEAQGTGSTISCNFDDEDICLAEVVHGSALDIAGKNVANPTALLLSAVMMLRHLNLNSEADQIDNAILKTISEGKYRTADLGGNSSTTDFTKAV